MTNMHYLNLCTLNRNCHIIVEIAVTSFDLPRCFLEAVKIKNRNTIQKVKGYSSSCAFVTSQIDHNKM